MKLIWIPRTISTLSYPIASRGYIFFRGMEILSMPFYSLRSKLIQPTNINSLNIWFLNINKKIIKYIRLYFAKMWSATVLSQILDNRLCPWPGSMHMKVVKNVPFHMLGYVGVVNWFNCVSFVSLKKLSELYGSTRKQLKINRSII